LDKFAAFTVIGLTTGAIYALAASGLVVTYTTSGIFNLSHGATGMLSAFAYWQMRFAWDWPAPLALAVTLLVLCPLYGAAIERFLLRGLQGTSEVVRLSVTVGLLVAAIGLANWVWPPETREAYRTFFEGNQVTILGYNVSWHKLITFGCAIAVAIGLRLLLFGTRAGVAMRAVVDDRSLTELNGGRPDRVATLAWAGSASLAGLAGVLFAGEQQLAVVPLTLLVVNAYAAAIFGRLRSLPLTFLGAVVLGLLDSYYTAYRGVTIGGVEIIPKSFFGYSLDSLRTALPIIALFIVLVALPQTRLRAGVARVRETSRAPSWSNTFVGVVTFVVFTIGISGMLTRSNTLYLTDALLLAIAALSLVPLTGYAGQVSLAPLTFAGLGTVFMTKLPGDGSILTLIATVLIVSAIGALVALPALRLSGVYLALATGAFAIFVSTMVFNQRRTFGSSQLNVPPLDIPGVDLSTPRARLIELAVAFSVLAIGVVALRRSKLGRRFIAVKDSQIASATLGMNLTWTKVWAFSISAGIASLAGALAGTGRSPDMYQWASSLPVVLLAVVGGVGTVSGALMAGISLGTNTISAAVMPAMKNVSKVLPGVIGIALGRNPDGATKDIGHNYKPLEGRWALIAISGAGGVGLWALCNFDVISRWSFAIGVAVWTLAIVTNLVALADPATPRRPLGIVALAAGLAVAIVPDWNDIATPGWRVLLGFALCVVTGQVARRLMDATPRVAAESPDTIGLDRPFTTEEIERADRILGVPA
jgi:branched-chain amino acid transport system permease protein